MLKYLLMSPFNKFSHEKAMLYRLNFFAGMHILPRHFKLCFYFLILGIVLNSRAQNFTEKPVLYSDSTANFIELVAFGGPGKRTPFWLQSNQFGTIPRSGPAIVLRSGFEQYWKIGAEENRNKNVWRFGMGIEVAGNISEKSNIIFPQLYATLRFRKWELVAGRKKQWIGLADSTLGTGSYALSGNAMPIPKIQIGTIGFVNVPFTKGWLSFNGFYSDGFFENNRPITRGLKLHQKALYLKIGNSNSRVKLLAGLNHQVQWGGKSPYYTKDGKLPDGFKNYLDAVTAKAYPVSDGLTPFDYNNRIGNHLGTIDLGMQYVGYEYSWFLYRQNIYEDGSLFRFENIKDGLNGLSIKKRNSYGADFEIRAFVFEFLFTKNQGGSIWDLATILGRDNYFNNGQVRDGWSYFDRTIGTPFITPTSETNWKWPNLADSFTSNNRVSVFHTGLSGTLFQKIEWSGKFSYSSNIGTYDEPFLKKPTQFSGIFSVQKKMNVMGGIQCRLSFAMDHGQLYANTNAFSVGFQKNLSAR